MPLDEPNLKGFNHPALAVEILRWREEPEAGDVEVAPAEAPAAKEAAVVIGTIYSLIPMIEGFLNVSPMAARSLASSNNQVIRGLEAVIASQGAPTRWLAMTSKHAFATPRRDAPELCIYSSPKRGRRERRVPAAPAASCA